MRGDGSYDTSHPGANWKLLIPAQAQGATVDYQLFTRNQQGNDYGFTGFTWSYTVAASGLVHNTFDTAYRAPGGAVPAGSSVVLKLAAKPGYASAADLVVYQYNAATNSTLPVATYPMTWDAAGGMWTRTYTTPGQPSIAYYKFKITGAAGDTSWYSDSYVDDGHDNISQGGTGNQSGSEPGTSFQPASQAPVAQIGGASTASPAGRAAESFSATAVTFDLAGTDERGIAKLKVTVDGLTTTVAKPDHQVRLSTAGRHTVTVVAIDTNGRSSAPVSAAITIDTTAPKTSAAMVSGKIKVTATDAGSGAAGTTYRINGGELLTYTGPVSAPKGATVTYSSIDRAGNGEAVRTFKVA